MRDLNISQLARELRISRQHIYNLIKKGLEYDEVAGRKYFNAAEVEEWIIKNKRGEI